MKLDEFQEFITQSELKPIVKFFDKHHINKEQFEWLKYDYILDEKVKDSVINSQLKKLDVESTMLDIIKEKKKKKLSWLTNYVSSNLESVEKNSFIVSEDFDKNVFVSKKAEELFLRLHEEYKNSSDHLSAKYSFIFYAMKNDKLLLCTQKYFINSYLEDLGIFIEINTRQNVIKANKRYPNYKTSKELLGIMQ